LLQSRTHQEEQIITDQLLPSGKKEVYEAIIDGLKTGMFVCDRIGIHLTKKGLMLLQQACPKQMMPSLAHTFNLADEK
jgi:hypothetical protein